MSCVQCFKSCWKRFSCEQRLIGDISWGQITLRTLGALFTVAGSFFLYQLIPDLKNIEFMTIAVFLSVYIISLLFPLLSVATVRRKVTLEDMRDDPLGETIFIRVNQVTFAGVFAGIWYWCSLSWNTDEWSWGVAMAVAQSAITIFVNIANIISRQILTYIFYLKQNRQREAASKEVHAAGISLEIGSRNKYPVSDYGQGVDD